MKGVRFWFKHAPTEGTLIKDLASGEAWAMPRDACRKRSHLGSLLSSALGSCERRANCLSVFARRCSESVISNVSIGFRSVLAMRSQILHHLHILHKFLCLRLLDLVTVFARRLRSEHIVSLAQPMGRRLSRFVKNRSASGVAESAAVKT